MSDSTVRWSQSRGVATVVLDNPPVNAWNRPMTDALRQALREITDDAGVRVVIVTGAGDKAFSAGSDIVEFSELLGPGEAVTHKLAPQNEVFSALEDLPKPTIAALNGYALGGGLEIAVCCDFIVAEEQVFIGSPEIALGVFPSSGGTFRVARRIGVGRAKEMQLLGNPVDAATALSWGLVNRVVPTGQAVTGAHDIAQLLLRQPSGATALCKGVLNRVHEFDRDELIALSLAASERAFTSPEARQGVDAFLARTTPDFSATSAFLDTFDPRRPT